LSPRTTGRGYQPQYCSSCERKLTWTVAAAKPNGSQDTWTRTLLGLDPTTGAVKAQLASGAIPHFASPAAAGGNLYVSGLGTVYAVSVA
jgi:hypothetical protein